MVKKSIKETFDKAEFLRHSMRLIFVGLNDEEIGQKVTAFLIENASAEGQQTFVDLQKRLEAENAAAKPSNPTG